MATRRSFMTGLVAAGLVPRPTWADAGRPAYVSAAMKRDGRYVLCGLNKTGSITFEIPLPDRGHAAAVHPSRPEAVAFARRPGTYAMVLDCRTGRNNVRLVAPDGRHFFGHGTFSGDGALLFTTENDYDAAAGVVGVWDARNQYTRIGEFSSGGVGPHDVKLMPDGQTLVVANGGIETHPETGRTKLNLPTMRSNLSYLTLDGTVVDQMHLPAEHQRNSIRHLAVSETGDVAFAMQWQGDLGVDLPLLGVHNRLAGRVDLLSDASVRKMRGYLGSVALLQGNIRIVVTSPRSGVLQAFGADGQVTEKALTDVCGVAAADHGFVVTTGTGLVRASNDAIIHHPLAWDNHLVRIL